MLKVTCSILCYNYGRFLGQAIESCLNQENGNFELEIIVIDDGSTDNTPEICQKYAGKIKYYRSENEGFASSLTRAVNYASGDLVCILDADDYFLPNKIKSVVEIFNSNDKVLFVFHDQAIVDENGHVIDNYFKGGNTSTHVFKKSAATDLLVAHNEQFFYTLFWMGKGFHLKTKLSHYRKHTTGMSRPKNMYVWKRKLVQMNILHLRKIRELMGQPPSWASSKEMEIMYLRIAAGYNFLKLEIALNENKFFYAMKCYFRILYFDLVSHQFNLSRFKLIISYFLLKRFPHY